MWCSDPRGPMVAMGLALAACGFTPLYGPGTPARAMQGRIEVAVIDGGPGFAMRERLTERLGAAADPAWRLDVDLGLERKGVALTQENFTTRFNVVGTARFSLAPVGGGPPVLVDEIRAITGYSAPVSQTATAFAIQSAERDAELRVARTLADDIVDRLAVTAGERAP